jgi:hypothetical protein
MPPDADRPLHFGVLALQAGLLDAGQFAEACAAWVARKDTALADLIVERGGNGRDGQQPPSPPALEPGRPSDRSTPPLPDNRGDPDLPPH